MTTRTYTVKEVAALLGFSTNTIYTFLKEKRLKGMQIGKTGRFRIPQEELDRLLQTKKSPEEVQPGQNASVIPGTINPIQSIGSRMFEVLPSSSRSLTLVDWYIGLAAFILGVSMFLYSIGQYSLTMAFYESWINSIRILFMTFGVGYLLSKVMYPNLLFWHRVYRWSLIATYFGFSYIAGITKQSDIMLLSSVQFFFVLAVTLFSFSAKQAFSFFVGLSVFSASIILSMTSLAPELIIPFSYLIPNLHIGIFIWCIWSTVFLFFLWYTNRKRLIWYPALLVFYAVSAFVFSVGYAMNLQWNVALPSVITGLFFILLSRWPMIEGANAQKSKVLLILFGALIVVFIIVVGGISAYQRTMFNMEAKQLAEKVTNVRVYIESIIELANKSFVVEEREIGLSEAIIKKDRETLTKICRKEFEEGNLFRRVLLLDSKGKEMAHYPLDPALEDVDFGYRQYVREVIATGKPYTSDSFESIGSILRIDVVIATPLFDQKTKRFNGILVGSLDMDAMNTTLQGFSISSIGEYVSVVDRFGKSIVQSRRDAVETDIHPRIAERITKLPTGGVFMEQRYNNKRERVFSGITRLDSLGWGILVSQPMVNTFSSPLIAISAILILVITSIGIIVGVFLYCRSIPCHHTPIINGP